MPQKKLRVLALMHEDLIPPQEVTLKGAELEGASWKTEHDVMRTLGELGHEVRALGIGSELGPIRAAIDDFKPHIAFNLVEGFADVATFDQNVVAYLELLKLPYTGCNSRGLLLARDKAIAKKLLSYHRIPVPGFLICPRGRRVKRPRRMGFPLFVKSLTLDASIGISQASVVESDEKLEERVKFIHESTGTDALGKLYAAGPSVADSTCSDWTSKEPAGKPWCGHSWPRVGSGASWLASTSLDGCAPCLGQNMGANCVGDTGGYGGIYCFAVK